MPNQLHNYKLHDRHDMPEDRTFINNAQELLSENNKNQFFPYAVMSHNVVIM